MRKSECIDHDRNLRFEHPADWLVSVESLGEHMPEVLVATSPVAAGGSGVMVIVSLDWHEFGELERFVESRLTYQAQSPGFNLRSKSTGRHATSGLRAISASCDYRANEVLQRKEMLFLGVSPGVVLSATACVPHASRVRWRDECRLIFNTLTLGDPRRPPVPSTGGLLGVGLRDRQSEQMKRLWMLLDLTAKNIVTVTGRLFEEQAGLSLGAAAHFETRSYLLYEMCLVMLGFRYPQARYNKVRQVFTHAIAGHAPTEQVPPHEGPLARLLEREKLYRSAEPGPVSKGRILAYAELLSTSGTGNLPQVIDPGQILRVSAEAETSPKAIVLGTHLELTMGYRLSLFQLFKETEDIERLSVAEIDRRFNAGVAAASE